MDTKDINTIEKFFQWLPNYMVHGDYLVCHEDDYGHLHYTLYNRDGEMQLQYDSNLYKITLYI